MAPSKANREKLAKACKAMKPFGVSAVTVKSALKRLLELYEKNWMYIEEDNYRLLIEAIFEPSGDTKIMDTTKEDFNLCDESDEEEEPPLKKPQLISPTSSSSEKQEMVETDIVTMDVLEDHHQDRGKKPMPLAVIHPDKKHIETMNVIEDHQDRGKEVDQVQFNNHVSKSTFPETICLDKDDQSPPRHSSKNASSSKSLAEGNGLLALEYKDLDGKENEEELPVSSEIDIASSSNGEVKLSFSICKPPQGFCIPSLDAIMKQIEDRYRERFRGLGSEFSLSDLLKEMCDSLMEQGIGADGLLPIETPRFLVADITRGYEKQKISLVNEFNEEKQPVFIYIPKNVIYKSANVKFMIDRISEKNCCYNCVDDCLSVEEPCACAAKTGGEFAYTIEGLVKENFLESCIAVGLNPNYLYCDNCPLERLKDRTQSGSGSCRGHLVRKFIKECWYKCGCGVNCGNHVVQGGIKANLQVFMTREGKGWGLRTLEDLPKGVFVCEYVGEIVTNNELFKRNEKNKNEKHTYPVLLDADWSSEGLLKDEEALCLDATSFGNVARFVNHRCADANMVEIPVEVESPDHHYYHLAFFTTREVKAMEELTWDYGIDFEDDSQSVKAFQCKCGSKLCRNIKRKRRSRCSQ